MSGKINELAKARAIINEIMFAAIDESDFGTSIELGIDFFCFGAPQLHKAAIQLLANGYALVNKPQFIAILKAHLEKRTKGISPSILN